MDSRHLSHSCAIRGESKGFLERVKILSPRLEVPDTDPHVPTWWEISEKILSAPKCSVLFDGTHVGFGSELDTHVVRKLPHVGVRITRKHFSFLVEEGGLSTVKAFKPKSSDPVTGLSFINTLVDSPNLA